ncbi:GtrA family protein [Marinomonas sp. TI.3.20]|uniref:GtrA family protein n=1 Tax=Marinomonas sp. TI.3.20 TaxID=3121296 RepID=UPI00311E0419
MIQTIFQKSFVRFAIVGSLGFLVDLISMIVLSFWLSPMMARAGAFWFAASSNWLWNRQFTFNTKKKMAIKEIIHQWAHFIFCSALSFIPNWGCYYFLMHFFTPNPQLHLLSLLWPYLAMAPGILIGLFLNYVFSLRWVFATNSNEPLTKVQKRPL